MSLRLKAKISDEARDFGIASVYRGNDIDPVTGFGARLDMLHKISSDQLVQHPDLSFSG
jgi:hypothetical protein